MPDIIIPAPKRKIVDDEMVPFQNDLIAFYKTMEEHVNTVINKGVAEGKTPEDIIKEAEAVIDGKVGG